MEDSFICSVATNSETGGRSLGEIEVVAAASLGADGADSLCSLGGQAP